MVHPKIRNMLLLCAIAASSDRYRAHSLAVSYSQNPTALLETDTQHITTLMKPTTTIFPVNNNTKAVSSQVATITNSVSKHANATASHGSTLGADAVRASASSREWISAILDTVVMALLGLSSIVIAVILGQKQLRAMGVQLQLMIDIAQGHLRANHVEMDDLERQHDSGLDGDQIEARSEISSVDPAADPSNGVATTGAGAGVLPEPQLYVVDEDLLTQPVRDREQASVQPRQLSRGDDSPHDWVEQRQREDEGQTPENTSTASGCSHLGRQDSKGLDFDGPKALLVDDRESHLLTIAGIPKHPLTLSQQLCKHGLRSLMAWLSPLDPRTLSSTPQLTSPATTATDCVGCEYFSLYYCVMHRKALGCTITMKPFSLSVLGPIYVAAYEDESQRFLLQRLS